MAGSRAQRASTPERRTARNPRPALEWLRMRLPVGPAGKLLPAILALATLIALGTAGFVALFGSPWLLAVYQTLVTISTLGDARVVPATTGQYAFIGSLTLLGYAAWGLFVAVVAGTLVTIDIHRRWEGPTLQERIAMLRGHAVVVGGGRVGHQVALELRNRGRDVLIVERNNEVARRLTELGFLVLVRDALEEGVLVQAGVDHASGVVLALPDDAQNLYVLLAVRDIAPRVRIVARAEGTRAEHHLRALGVERVVMPTALGGKRLARLIARPLTTDFLDTVVEEAGLDLREHPVLAGDALDGRPVRDVRHHLGETATLLAIHRDGQFLPLPPAVTTIRPGDVLMLACLRQPSPAEE